MAKDAILILGSKTDIPKANIVLGVWKTVRLNYRVAIASCHRHGGGEFAKFIRGINEKLIVFIGGMSLAAPGLIEVINKKAEKFDVIVFGIPTDKAALSAIQDLPKGTAIITSGLNRVSVNHSITNSALATAKLASMLDYGPNNKSGIFYGLWDWYAKNLEENPLVEELELDKKGLIPLDEPKKL